MAFQRCRLVSVPLKPCIACASCESVVLLPCFPDRWSIDYTTRTLWSTSYSVSSCCTLATKNKVLSSVGLVSVLICSPFSQQQLCIKNYHCAITVIPCAAMLTCDIKGCKQLQRNICQYVSTVAFIKITLHISCSPCCLPLPPTSVTLFVSSRRTKYKLLEAVQLR